MLKNRIKFELYYFTYLKGSVDIDKVITKMFEENQSCPIIIQKILVETVNMSKEYIFKEHNSKTLVCKI